MHIVFFSVLYKLLGECYRGNSSQDKKKWESSGGGTRGDATETKDSHGLLALPLYFLREVQC